ncbi:hypothetical protein Ae201684P_011502 [Aphanomyces euteiches]|uniref:Niemann-Pick C1 N-terminal domain-containing protein n=1 Tax=Aphanomyces euteiches TaxID=100861 RepID=A0A6G0XXU0_9STRA|nr:hypothetical protein Ae201684_000402 [Aphanomyces euteiches]KAH9091961.1 hypothetical protein Ae201684P_011502 [Aphanomyces euteiches]KAH9149674.1 hypothetical protein AeRB84_007336 [Aphanomyces euteiches]
MDLLSKRVSWIVGICMSIALAIEVEVLDHGQLVKELGISSSDSQTSPWIEDGHVARQLATEDGTQTALSTCDLSLYQAYLAREGKDIFVQSSLCEASIEYLKLRLAGSFGPVLQSDMQSAMSQSHCTCTELSSDSYITQDFCRQNSARMLCSILGVCGTWGCSLNDFMCPRYDWDRLYPCGSYQVQLSMWALTVAIAVVIYGT